MKEGKKEEWKITVLGRDSALLLTNGFSKKVGRGTKFLSFPNRLALNGEFT